MLKSTLIFEALELLTVEIQPDIAYHLGMQEKYIEDLLKSGLSGSISKIDNQLLIGIGNMNDQIFKRLDELEKNLTVIQNDFQWD